VGKYGTVRQVTDDNIIRHMRIACWITKATDTHSEYVILLFHSNNGYANAPQCYVTRTLPVLQYFPSFLSVSSSLLTLPVCMFVLMTLSVTDTEGRGKMRGSGRGLI
jgi:hypothetical protein